VDGGPHPNRAHARWGRQLHRLDPDPATAPHVRWIFARRLAGESTAGIARELNERGVRPPSGHDPERNRHRSGQAWTLRTVAEILANPRYTGRQVWNRQRTDHNETRPGDKRSSRGAIRRWNAKDEWVVSTRIVHPPLVSESDFVRVQSISAVASPADGQPRRYLLTGLVVCNLCGRRADAHWLHGRPGYRCRHGRTSANPSVEGRPKPLYLREDELLTAVARQLGKPITAVTAFLGRNALLISCDRGKIALIGGRKQRPPPDLL
jgi:site-specific DNA recombinase